MEEKVKFKVKEISDEATVNVEISGFFAKRLHESTLALGMIMEPDKLIKFQKVFESKDASQLTENEIAAYMVFETLLIFNGAIQAEFEKAGLVTEVEKELPDMLAKEMKKQEEEKSKNNS